MKYPIAPFALIACLAACSAADEDAAAVALADNGVPAAAIEDRRAAQPSPGAVQNIPTLQTMAAPDFDAARMTGPGCRWREADDADVLFAFDQGSGVVKVDGGYVRLVPVADAPALPLGTRRLYRGGQLTVDVESVDVAAQGGQWPAAMTLSVDGGQTLRIDGGLLSCRG